MTEMKKLFEKLFGKRRDPLATLRAEPTDDTRSTLRAELFEQDRLDALRRGHVVHNDWTNVAHGSPGYVTRSLHQEGLMSCRGEATPMGWLWHYRTTPKGYAYITATLSEA